VRQLVTESVVLAGLAGLVGVAAAIWLTRVLVAAAPGSRIPHLERVTVDAPVIAFAVLLTLAVGVLFGLVPAWQSARAGAPSLISGAPGRVTSSRATERWRSLLVALQVTSTSVLLVGAVLLGRSLLRLTGTDDGFSARGVVTATIQLPESAERPAVIALWHGLLDDLRRRPGFEGVSAINQMPLNEFFFIRGDFALEGQRLESAWTAKPKVAPGYFRALGIPLVRGRDFAMSDDAVAPKVAIVSELFVRLYMNGRDPIGARVSLSEGEEPWFTIVGVVGDIRQSGPADTPIQAVYVPFAQSEGTFFVRTMSLVVPTTFGEEQVAQAVRDALRRLDPALPILEVSRLDDRRVQTLAEPRFRTFLIAVFALIALTLAAAGLFALVSQTVAQRWRELGVRLALGARGDQIARLVIGRAMWPVAIGLAAGLGLALWLAAALAPFLFEVAPRDIVSITLATVMLLASALAASALPAWRATRIDPTTALRAE
jgi:putative ABC transport system permease protein